MQLYKNKIVSFVMDECVINSSEFHPNFCNSYSASWCNVVSCNDDKYLLKKVSIKLLYHFLYSLPVDQDSKHLIQTEVILKIMLEGSAVQDKFFTPQEYIKIRK